MNVNRIHASPLLITAGFALVVTICLSNAGPSDTVGGKSQLAIPASADGICPVKIGAKLPALALTTVEGKAFDVNAVVAKKPTVLVFYRGGWCPYCNLQLASLQDIEPKLLAMGYQIIAVSTDRLEGLRKSIEKHDLKYTLLSDSKMDGAKALGIAYKVDDATVERYKQYGIDLEKASGEKHHLLPVPSVFMLGTDGTISFEYINPNYKVRLNPDLLLAAAKAGLEGLTSANKQGQ